MIDHANYCNLSNPTDPRVLQQRRDRHGEQPLGRDHLHLRVSASRPTACRRSTSRPTRPSATLLEQIRSPRCGRSTPVTGTMANDGEFASPAELRLRRPRPRPLDQRPLGRRFRRPARAPRPASGRRAGSTGDLSITSNFRVWRSSIGRRRLHVNEPTVTLTSSTKKRTPSPRVSAPRPARSRLSTSRSRRSSGNITEFAHPTARGGLGEHELRQQLRRRPSSIRLGSTTRSRARSPSRRSSFRVRSSIRRPATRWASVEPRPVDLPEFASRSSRPDGVGGVSIVVSREWAGRKSRPLFFLGPRVLSQVVPKV